MCQKWTKMVQGWNRFVSNEPKDAKILEIDFFQSGNGMKNYSKPPRLTAFFLFSNVTFECFILASFLQLRHIFCFIHPSLYFKKSFSKCTEPVLDPKVLWKIFELVFQLWSEGYIPEFFCRTRWVWSTFSSHCPLFSKQCHWLTTATSKISFSENILVMLGLKPGAAGSRC